MPVVCNLPNVQSVIKTLEAIALQFDNAVNSVYQYIKSLVPENISLTLKIGTDIIKMFSSHASALNSLSGSSHSFSLC